MRFKPGQSGNPNGRPPVPAEIKEARKMTRAEVEEILNRYLQMDLGELNRKLLKMQADVQAQRDTGIPMIEAMILTLTNKALVEGDHVRLDFLLDRIIGPVEKKISVIDETPRDVIPIALTPDEKLKMLDRYREYILDKGKPEGKANDPSIVETEYRNITSREDLS